MPLWLITDASVYAYGAVLAHKINGIFHPIMFHGKCFSASEYKSLSIFEKELKGLYYSVRHFASHLKGRQFHILTDNKGVCFLRTLSLKDTLTHRWLRWISYLCEFNFTIGAIKSEANPSDCISRMPCFQKECKICEGQHKFLHVPFKFREPECLKAIATENVACQTDARFNRSIMSQRTQNQTQVFTTETSTDSREKFIDFGKHQIVAQIQDQHKDFQSIKERIKESKPPPENVVANSMSPQTKRLIPLWDNLSITNEVLFLSIIADGQKINLPIIPRESYFDLCHYIHEELLHPGASKMYHYLRSNFIVFGISHFVKEFTRSCEKCQMVKPNTRCTKAHMISYSATEPNAVLQIDHLGPFPPSTQGHFKYVLSLVDVFSKYMILIPQTRISSVDVAKAIIDHYVQPFGCPRRIHSDNAAQFTSQEWKGICDQLNITQTFSSPYYPQSNGTVESLNKEITAKLIIGTKSYRRTWTYFIPTIAMTHNATVNSTTGYTPNKLFLGREVHLPSNLLTTNATNEIKDYDSYVDNFATRLHLTLHNARKNTTATQKTAKHYYDFSAKNINTFTSGQLILLKDMTPRGKLDMKFPNKYKILKRLHNHTYLVERISDGFQRKANVAHIKPFYSRHVTTNSKTKDSSTQTNKSIDTPHHTHTVIDLPITQESVNLPSHLFDLSDDNQI